MTSHKRLTLNGALVIAVTTLAGVIGWMGLQAQTEFAGIRQQLEACQKDRAALWESQQALWYELLRMKLGME